MTNYPRIYSFSTVGVVMHYNQDYLLHEIRTDFAGKNGIGKSLIADLFQILFIADKKKIAFGTESVKSNDRLIHTIPHKSTSDAYVFINIEFEKDNFITIGINISNNSKSPLRSFWILNQTYNLDEKRSVSLKELGINKTDIPTFDDFIIANTIPRIDKLAVHLRDAKNLYLRSFSDKNQKSEFFCFLFQKEILPINLSIDSNLSAFAKVIQSFSKAKTLNTESDESLKRFLFENGNNSFKSEYNLYKKKLRDLLESYYDLKNLIVNITAKQTALTNLNHLKDKMSKSHETFLCIQLITNQYELEQKEAQFKEASKKLRKAQEEISDLRQNNPKMEAKATAAQKELEELSSLLKKLKDYESAFERLSEIKANITKLEKIELPDVSSEVAQECDISEFAIENIVKRINQFIPIYKKYGSFKKIDDARSIQQNLIEERKHILKKKKENISTIIDVLSKKKEGTLFSEIISKRMILTKGQEAVLFSILSDIHWNKPEMVQKGVKYVTGIDFLDKKNVIEDFDHKGYWFATGEVKEFFPYTKEKRIFSNLEDINQILNTKKEALQVSKKTVESKLKEIENLSSGQKYDSNTIKIDTSLDQNIVDHTQIKGYGITLGIIQNLKSKKNQYSNELKKEQKIMDEILQAIDYKIIDKKLAHQIQEVSDLIEAKESEKTKLREDFISKSTALKIKVENLPNLEDRPKELEPQVARLRGDLKILKELLANEFPSIKIDYLNKGELYKSDLQESEATYNKSRDRYISTYSTIAQSYGETIEDIEIKEQIENDNYYFDILEQKLLGPQIKHTGNITDALSAANNSRLEMAEAIHETMLKIFQQTKIKFEEYRELIGGLNTFFKGKKISDKYYFQIDFKSPKEYNIDWINKLQISSQLVHKEGGLLGGQNVESFVEDFFQTATGLRERIKFSDLLDPKTYFELETRFTDENNNKKPPSTGQSYASILLLGIGRLSVVLDAKRKGLRFLILEEVSNLDSANFSTFPNIADEFGYQILTMTPKPFGSNTDQGWYLHHLIEGKGDKDINYPIPNSYYKTNEGREELYLHLRNRTNLI